MSNSNTNNNNNNNTKTKEVINDKEAIKLRGIRLRKQLQDDKQKLRNEMSSIGHNAPTHELILLSKARELFIMIYPSLERFPRYERHGMAIFIKNAFIDLLSNISRASKVKSKRVEISIQASINLEVIDTMLFICNRNGYYTDKYYEVIDMRLTELKKIIVGYIKSASRKTSKVDNDNNSNNDTIVHSTDKLGYAANISDTDGSSRQESSFHP